jgi:multidrug transporter EmrE-like cation transporter
MMRTYFLMFSSIGISAVAHIFLKHGMVAVARKGPVIGPHLVASFLKIFGNPYVSVGFALYAIAALMWIVVLSKVPLSIAYPSMGVSYVLILFASKYVFREDITVFRVLGTALIIAGVILVQIKSDAPKPQGAAPAPECAIATSK